ncbi:stage II sporulation protein M [Singulisphaera sp. PoT]|uniref:stage II sporulation protein M n=1 Tax=Singulisphaera sp. PoT TaxID=3411797 RepID=UPI003BF581DF
MRVADRLAQREGSWRELDEILENLSSRKVPRSQRSALILRLGELYRSACTDLMLAEAHDLPRDTITYLHALVGRAHNAVYRAKGFRFKDWGFVLFNRAPRILRSDPAVKISAMIFYGGFILCALLAAGQPDFARRVLPESSIEEMENMYEQPLKGERKDGMTRDDSMMAGFYIQHNTSIGLRCFAGGLLFGLGSIYELASNALLLGTVFGYMATTSAASNFYTFVTAHAPFELTAIVLAGAAGMRLGYGLIETKGETRVASLHREAKNALPVVSTSVVLFVFAAFIEGYVSASSLEYIYKALVAIGSAVVLVAYLALGGRTVENPTEGNAPAISSRTALSMS